MAIPIAVPRWYIVNKGKTLFIAPATLLVIAIVSSMVLASVFVVYPGQLTVSYATNDIQIQPGNNTGLADLNGNTIDVAVGSKNASVSITVHPTYQYTYYKNITIINNTGTAAYYIGFYIDSTSITLADAAKLYVFDSSGGLVATIDLKTTGWSGWIGPLASGSYYRIDLVFHVAETESISGVSETVSFYIYWSPSSETPPAPSSLP